MSDPIFITWLPGFFIFQYNETGHSVNRCKYPGVETKDFNPTLTLLV